MSLTLIVLKAPLLVCPEAEDMDERGCEASPANSLAPQAEQ